MSITSVGAVGLQVQLQSNNMTKQAADVATKAEGTLTSGFSKIGGMIAKTLAVTALAKFGSDCIELGSNLSEVQNVVDVTFPSMNSKVNAFATNAAGKFGLSETMAKKYMGTLGSMSEAFGFTESASESMAEQITGLSGDVASFYNISQDEAYTKLKSVFTGETESLKDLGVVMTQSALDQYALANGYGKTTDKMSEQEKVSLRLAFVTNALSNASGDFQRTSTGWANQMRILSLNFQTFKATMGQGLINAFAPIITVVNILMSKLNTLAKYFAAFTKIVFGSAGSTGAMASNMSSAADGATELDNAVGGASSDSGKVASNMGKAADSAKAMKGSLASFDTLNTMTSESDSGSSSGSGSSAGGIDTGSLGIGVGDVDTSGLDEIETKVSEFVNFWKEKIGSVVSFFKDNSAVIIGIVGGIVAGFAAFEVVKNWGSIVGVFKTVTDNLGFVQLCFSEFFGTLTSGGSIFEAFSAIFGTVTGPAILIGLAIAAISAAVIYLWQTSETFRNALTAGFASLMGILNNIYTNVLLPLFGFISSVFQTILVPLATFIIDVFVKAVEVLIEILMAIWNNVLAPIANFLVDILAVALQGVIDVWNAWKPVIDKVMSWLLDLWNNVLSPIVDFVKDYLIARFEEFGKVIAAVIKSALQIFHGLVEFLVGIFTGDMNRAWGGIKEIFKGFSNFLNTIFTTDWTKSFGVLGVGLNEFFRIVKGIFDSVKQIFGGIIDFIAGVFTGDWSRAWKGVVSIFDGIVSGIASIFKTPLNWIIGGINDFINGINNISIPDWVPVVGGLGFNIPNIPYLAQGGYVGPNSPRLAVIGDNKTQGEIVAPEDKIRNITEDALKNAGSMTDAQAIVSMLEKILDALMNLGLDVDVDQLVKVIDRRNKQRSLMTGKLVAE